jgi:mannose-6-phosphate isomerase-like protein (cupin superfamily)
MDKAGETRPWGGFVVLEEGPGFKVKRISVKPGGRLSLQSHRHRSEHWTVVNGTATVTVHDQVTELTRGQSTDIPLGARHRLENFHGDMVEVIEVQFGDYLGEDDITRHADVYHRS